jgi:hypothetical protein
MVWARSVGVLPLVVASAVDSARAAPAVDWQLTQWSTDDGLPQMVAERRGAPCWREA